MEQSTFLALQLPQDARHRSSFEGENLNSIGLLST